MSFLGRLHILTDTTIQRRWTAAELAEKAIEGGADVIQYREKRLPAREMIACALEIGRIGRRRKVPLIINDRVDVAYAVDARGVHLGQGDLPIPIAREILGPDRLLGGSADSAEEARALAAEGADYAGIGPVFPTSSKDDAGPVLGIDDLARAVREVDLPLIAIGGITPENLATVLQTGVHGVAVLSAVCLADDPAAATRRMREVFDQFAARVT
jgi:thiamine-phosphate pyrophosphorylase